MNLEQQKSLYALLDAAVRMHRMALALALEDPYAGHSSIPDSIGNDIPCEYCGIINLAEYNLSEIYANHVYEKFIAPAPLDVERLIAHLRQQVRNDSESAAWRHGVEYAIECIESAALAEVTP
jgi:hypothetical protein